MTVSVLSIDGGGMKGIISAITLKRLEKYLKEYSKDDSSSLIDYFDLVAGTSTGSILTALLLCRGEKGRPRYTIDDVLEMYLSRGKEMFHKRTLYPINTLFGLFGSKYTNKYFYNALNEYFGDLKISELLRPCLIVSYDMKRRRTLFFNSSSSKKNENKDMKVADAVLASCAAPTYFPPVNVHIGEGCSECLIDGGVSANNPSMSALIEALKMSNVQTINDVYLLSMGNATKQKSYDCKQVKRWGLIGFALPIFDVIMTSSEEIVDYELKKLYESRQILDQYQRIEAVISESIPAMDDTSTAGLNRFVEIGNNLADQSELILRNFAKKLVAIKTKNR